MQFKNSCGIISFVKYDLEVNELPNIKSAKKRVKVISTKTLRNQMIKTNIKTLVKKFEGFVAKSDKENAILSFKAAVKKIDQAVAKGVMHKNTAARKKSQLSNALNNIA